MNQKAKILQLLWDGKWHSVNELDVDLKIRQYNARVYDLRQEGFEIENKKFPVHTGSLTFFRLITPTKNIDFESLKLKPSKQQMELL